MKFERYFARNYEPKNFKNILTKVSERLQQTGQLDLYLFGIIVNSIYDFYTRSPSHTGCKCIRGIIVIILCLNEWLWIIFLLPIRDHSLNWHIHWVDNSLKRSRRLLFSNRKIHLHFYPSLFRHSVFFQIWLAGRETAFWGSSSGQARHGARRPAFGSLHQSVGRVLRTSDVLAEPEPLHSSQLGQQERTHRVTGKTIRCKCIFIFSNL